jgi:hypothetical protein
MVRAAMSPEAKAKLLERLKAGREKHKELRAKDPNHKPRKPRAKKVKEPLPENEKLDTSMAIDPMTKKPANNSIPGIDAPRNSSVNTIAAQPVNPVKTETSHIDVPNLPEDKDLKKIVKNAESLPEVPQRKGLSSSGKPKRENDNDLLVNEETGMKAIETMLPGQKESIKKLLCKNKKLDPLAPVSNPSPSDKTVEKVKTHIPDIKAVEARQPFSFSAVRKLLYQ